MVPSPWPLIACCAWACAAAVAGSWHFAAGALVASVGCLVGACATTTTRRVGLVALPAFLAAATPPPPAAPSPEPGLVRVAGRVDRIVRTPSLGGALLHCGGLRIALDDDVAALPGDTIELLGHAAAPIAPGLPPTLRGVAATARIVPGPLSLPRLCAAARRALEAQLLTLLPGEAGPLVAGLVLGRDTRPADATQAAHRGTGLSHLLAVSGAHAAMLALLLGLGGPRGRRRILASGVRTAALLVLLFGYALVTGGEPPVLRAVLGYALAAWAVRLGRPCGAAAVLLAPALVTAFAAPAELAGASFLLSYAAVAGLLLTATPPADAGPLRRWLWAPLAASAWATLTTAPLTLWFFGQLAPWTVLLTPLLAPLVAVLLVGGLGLALLGLCAPAAAAVGASALAAAAELYLAAVHAADTLPWTPLPALCAPSPWAMIAAGLGAVATLRRWPGRRGVAAAAALLMAPHFLPRAEPTEPFLLLAAVGHGQACLLGDAEGRRIAIDCGSVQAPGRAAEQVANALTRRRLDLLVVTHADADHHNAVPSLLERVHVVRALVPQQLAASPLAALLAAHGAAVDLVPPGARIAPWPGLVVAAPALPPGARDNDQSLWVRAELGATCALLTGDAQELGVAAALAQGLVGPCDALVLPHHGRANANAARLLQACQPVVCLASAAAADGPTRLGALALARGAGLWSTGLHGALRLCGATGAVSARPLVPRRRARRGSLRAARRRRRGDGHELADPTEEVPILHVDRARLVDADAVRRQEHAVLPLVARHAVLRAHARLGIVAEVADELVVLVEQRDAASEVGDDEAAVRQRRHVARPAQVLLHRAHVRAVHREPLQAMVLAVAHEQQRLLATAVEPDAMRRLQLAGVVARAAERLHVLAVLVVEVDPRAAVAIGGEDAAIGADRDRRRVVLALVLVDARGLGPTERPQDRAVELRLDDLVAARVREVQHLLAALVAQAHAVQAALELLAPRAQQLALGGERHHRVLGVGVRQHVAVLVDDEAAVRVAEVLAALEDAPALHPRVAGSGDRAGHEVGRWLLVVLGGERRQEGGHDEDGQEAHRRRL